MVFVSFGRNETKVFLECREDANRKIGPTIRAAPPGYAELMEEKRPNWKLRLIALGGI